MHIPRGVLESAIEARVPREQKVVLYCASGNRSALAADVLREMGYATVARCAAGSADGRMPGATSRRDGGAGARRAACRAHVRGPPTREP